MTNELEVWLDDATLVAQPRRVGVLARSAARGGETIRFRYDKEWLGGHSCGPAQHVDHAGSRRLHHTK